MKIRKRTPRLTGDENIVPMINVVFLLLIFFLLAGTLTVRPPFKLDPVITTLNPPTEAPYDGLYVSAEGQIYFQGQSVRPQDLRGLLGSAAASGAAPQELIADRQLKGELLMPVLEALAQAGVEKVRLVTQRDPG